MKRILRMFGRVVYLFSKNLPVSTSKTGFFGRNLRYFSAKCICKSVGRRVNIEKGAVFASDICIGDDSALGIRSYVEEGTIIGNYVMMGPECMIFTRNHRFERTDLPMCKQGETEVKPVIIEDDVWLGARVTILPGARIGHGCVIGAGTVVSGEIPPMSVAVGNPARVVKKREE